MKKILSLCLSSLILITLIPLTGFFRVKADTYYPIGCSVNEYEVSYINDDGTFSKISCHGSFSDAKQAMKANEDYVVRYEYSYSPSKIVAMNGGLAYSYPNRRSSATMQLYQDPSKTESSLYKQTYISRGYELNYVDTYSVNSDGKGYIRADMNGFEGFADLEYTDLVPFKYINKGIAIYLGGSRGDLVSYGSEYPFLVRLEQNYYIIEQNGNYLDLVFYYHYAYGNNGSKCKTYSMSVDNAKHYIDAGMRANVRYYSSDGINFYADNKLTNKVATCYNYYQFLSLRTKTSISASVFDSYVSDRSGSVMKNEGQSFINAQNEYGFNALLVYAMACQESAYGTSGYARNRYNLFGWSAVDADPDNASYFSSVASCVDTLMGRYLNWFTDFTNRRYFGYCMGNKGAGLNVNYASDPYWGQGIAAIAYNIDKYANGKNGNLSDYDRYQLGLVAANYNDVLYGSNVYWDAKFYKTLNGNDVLFTGRYGSHYQKDLIVAIAGEENGRYIVQTPNPLENNEMVTRDGVLDYDWNDSVAFIDKKDVTILYTNGTPVPETPAEIILNDSNIARTSISSITYDSDILTIKGTGLITGIDFTDPNKVSHIIELHSYEKADLVYSYNAANTETPISLNDTHDYRYAGFEISIDLSKLEAGTYYPVLKTGYLNASRDSTLITTSTRYKNIVYQGSGGYTYLLKTNYLRSSRIEIEKTSLDIGYSYNLASGKTSLNSCPKLIVNEEGRLQLEGYAMIYNGDYSAADQNRFTLYLHDGQNLAKQQSLNNVATYDYLLDYLKAYSNIGYICYEGNIDLTDLSNGDYVLMLKIVNGDYIDFVEFSGDNKQPVSTVYNNKTYTLMASTVRNRMILRVSD